MVLMAMPTGLSLVMVNLLPMPRLWRGWARVMLLAPKGYGNRKRITSTFLVARRAGRPEAWLPAKRGG